jgi:hypothetical protein
MPVGIDTNQSGSDIDEWISPRPCKLRAMFLAGDTNEAGSDMPVGMWSVDQIDVAFGGITGRYVGHSSQIHGSYRPH